ncbi:MAG: hypothetical protein V1835_04055 [Candidatus Micrarchaeota archaeon]
MWKEIGFAGILLLAIVGVAYAASPMGTGYGKGNANNADASLRAGRSIGMGMQAASQYPAELAQFQKAIADNNYAVANELHESYGFGGRMFDALTPEAFSQKSQLHNAIQGGDAAKANEIRQQLSDSGFNFGNGMKNGSGNGNGIGRGIGRGSGNCMNA